MISLYEQKNTLAPNIVNATLKTTKIFENCNFYSKAPPFLFIFFPVVFFCKIAEALKLRVNIA